MDESLAVRSHVDNLFKYLDTYERSYAQFQTEAFLQNYRGIRAVFQALRKQRDKAVALDEIFLEKIKQSSLTASDLRQLTIQLLITFFESEADIDGLSNHAYSMCRGVRAVKQDVPFFENHLVPLLFRQGGLNDNVSLNSFFLSEIALYLNRYGRSLQTDLSPEQFGGLTDPMKILQLARRRLQLGSDLLADRTTLEFHLKRIAAFNKLRQKSRLNEYYLKQWGYLTDPRFWLRVKGFFGELWGKIRGVFSSWRYFGLVLSQRNPAYLFYGLLIVLFVLLAIYVPIMWSEHGRDRLEQLDQRNHIDWKPR
ncbi:MAG: hypothetical protein ABII79_12045 [bacterium]